jgi:hypothetical protein
MLNNVYFGELLRNIDKKSTQKLTETLARIIKKDILLQCISKQANVSLNKNFDIEFFIKNSDLYLKELNTLKETFNSIQNIKENTTAKQIQNEYEDIYLRRNTEWNNAKIERKQEKEKIFKFCSENAIEPFFAFKYENLFNLFDASSITSKWAKAMNIDVNFVSKDMFDAINMLHDTRQMPTQEHENKEKVINSEELYNAKQIPPKAFKNTKPLSLS